MGRRSISDLEVDPWHLEKACEDNFELQSPMHLPFCHNTLEACHKFPTKHAPQLKDSMLDLNLFVWGNWSSSEVLKNLFRLVKSRWQFLCTKTFPMGILLTHSVKWEWRSKHPRSSLKLIRLIIPFSGYCSCFIILKSQLTDNTKVFFKTSSNS